MLLDEHRRHADDEAQRQHDPLQVPPAQRPGVEAGERQRRAADDMHARQHVCVGVGGIDALHQPGEQIVLREFCRPQILPVREDQTEQDRPAEAEADIEHVPLEPLRVVKHQIERHQKQQRMPQAVGDDEIAAEGDLVVQRQIGDPVIVGHNMLRNGEQRQIDEPDQQIPVVVIIFNRPELQGLPAGLVLGVAHEVHQAPCLLW